MTNVITYRVLLREGEDVTDYTLERTYKSLVSRKSGGGSSVRMIFRGRPSTSVPSRRVKWPRRSTVALTTAPASTALLSICADLPTRGGCFGFATSGAE